MTQFGLDDALLDALRQAFKASPSIDSVQLFGSRARGDFKPHSDVDLAVDAPAMSDAEWHALLDRVDALPLVFPIDILHMQRLAHDAPIRDVIMRDRVKIYP